MATRVRIAFARCGMSVTCVAPDKLEARSSKAVMSPKLIMGLSGFVPRMIRSEVDGRPRTVTVDVMARLDVANELGLVIGSEQPVDARSCLVSTNMSFSPPI